MYLCTSDVVTDVQDLGWKYGYGLKDLWNGIRNRMLGCIAKATDASHGKGILMRKSDQTYIHVKVKRRRSYNNWDVEGGKKIC